MPGPSQRITSLGVVAGSPKGYMVWGSNDPPKDNAYQRCAGDAALQIVVITLHCLWHSRLEYKRKGDVMKIEIAHLCNEYRALFLFGESIWFPYSFTIDWAKQ